MLKKKAAGVKGGEWFDGVYFTQNLWQISPT